MPSTVGSGRRAADFLVALDRESPPTSASISRGKRSSGGSAGADKTVEGTPAEAEQAAEAGVASAGSSEA